MIDLRHFYGPEFLNVFSSLPTSFDRIVLSSSLVRSIRLFFGMTQVRFASALDIKIRTLQSWEQCRTLVPISYLLMFIRIADKIAADHYIAPERLTTPADFNSFF